MGPIFILGFPRSGTTAMATGISMLSRFGSYVHEGHFLNIFGPPICRIVEGKTNPNSIFSDESKKPLFLTEFAKLVNRLHSGNPDDTTWIDKTPDVAQVKAIPALNALFPNARYIYMYRPIEEAVRSSIAMPDWKLNGRELDVANRWIDCQRSWRKMRALLRPEQLVQVLQNDMLNQPYAVAHFVAEVLKLTEQEESELGGYWRRNQKINRPTGNAGDRYDSVALDPDVEASIAALAAEEVSYWPRLKNDDTAVDDEAL